MPRMAARLLIALTLLITATPAYLSAATPTLAESMAQRAYDACTASFNKKYRHLDPPKAIVSGVSNGNTKCFWNWGGSSVSTNIRNATAACEKEMARCFLYHESSGGNTSWVQRISDMGGSDGSRENDAATNEALVNMLSGAITTLGIINGAQGAGGGGYGGGGGDDGARMGGGSVCTPAQRARGWSEERCALN